MNLIIALGISDTSSCETSIATVIIIVSLFSLIYFFVTSDRLYVFVGVVRVMLVSPPSFVEKSGVQAVNIVTVASNVNKIRKVFIGAPYDLISNLMLCSFKKSINHCGASF